MDQSTAERLGKITVDDVLNDPHSLGLPTFEEYAANREKYVGKTDEVFGSVEKGGETNAVTQKHIYEICGYRTRKLSEVEKIAHDHGIDIRGLGYRAAFIPQGAGKADVLVKFMPDEEARNRNRW